MTAIFAGTFDPFTVGHKEIVRRALDIFGSVIIAVADETGKSTASLDARVRIVKLSVSDLNCVTVEPFSGLLSDYVKSKKNAVLVRGIRNAADFDYERELCEVYRSLGAGKTVHIISAPEYSAVSSTTVRRLAALGAELSAFVDGAVLNDIISLYGIKE